jgi:hypothetical protein
MKKGINKTKKGINKTKKGINKTHRKGTRRRNKSKWRIGWDMNKKLFYII